MNGLMKQATKETLLMEGVCREEQVDALIGVLESKARKLDRCGRSKCNHEHMIPQLISQLMSDRQSSTKDRLEEEKKKLIQDGLSVKKVMKSKRYRGVNKGARTGG